MYNEYNQFLASSRYFIIERFCQIEDRMNLIIYSRYTNAWSSVDDFVQDLLMSWFWWFGLKRYLFKKLGTDFPEIKNTIKKILILLEDLEKVRNYFAHTVLSSTEEKNGKVLHRGTKKINYEEKNMDWIVDEYMKKSFDLDTLLNEIENYMDDVNKHNWFGFNPEKLK